jgi:hypothetical protein
MWKILDHSIKGDKYVFKFRWMKTTWRSGPPGLLASVYSPRS